MLPEPLELATGGTDRLLDSDDEEALAEEWRRRESAEAED